MNQSIENQILECEDQLKQAMLYSDIAELDKLLATDLIFTNHLGQLMTKKDDLTAHKQKILKISKIVISDQKIKIYGDIAIVVAHAHIVARFNDEESENNFRFTRVWRRVSKNAWEIIAGHSGIVV